jgi:hypothetical protein
MAYSDLIPAAPTSRKTSQGDLLANFAAIGTAFEVEHEAFNTVSEGKHKFIKYPVQTAPPTYPTNYQYGATLYSYQSTYTGQPELAFAKYGAGVGGAPLSLAGELSSCAPAPTATSGWTVLPGRLVMKWGTLINQVFPPSPFKPYNLITAPILFPTTPTCPKFTEIYSMQATEVYRGGSDVTYKIIIIQMVDMDSFRLELVKWTTHAGATSNDYSWLALGSY